jgi:DNA-binding transcriptional regulator LsrR (DeoR family)
VLHYLDDLTQEEIAASIGWSRQTVFKKLTLLRTSAARWKDEIFGEGRRK